MTILIPAYEPDKRLLSLIDKIKSVCSYKILIVDDGSGDGYRELFKTAREKGCTVLTHPINKGKGCALKTGFKYIMQNGEKEGVVCADSDGQHLPGDIIKVAKKIIEYKGYIILGSRHFVGSVPPRSRMGNFITRKVCTFVTGLRIHDTQSGLRGFSPDMLDWLCRIPGERYEYEMNMILEAHNSGYDFYEVEIDTVYYDGNRSSHFRSVADSVRVYLPLMKFSASSLISGILDFVLLFILKLLTSNLLLSAVGARICSSLFNYTFNKRYVFSTEKEDNGQKSLIRYYTLAAFVMAANYLLLSLLNEHLGFPLFWAKLLTEIILFLLNYWVQHRFVFRSRHARTSLFADCQKEKQIV